MPSTTIGEHLPSKWSDSSDNFILSDTWSSNTSLMNRLQNFHLSILLMLTCGTNSEYNMNILSFASLNNTGFPVFGSNPVIPAFSSSRVIQTLWSSWHSNDPEYHASRILLSVDARVEQWLKLLFDILWVVSLKTYCRFFAIENTFMSRENVSGWVRQLRYRAKKHDLYSDLNISEVHNIIDHYKDKCCLCESDFEVLDTCFPLKDGAPNIQANIMPFCHDCKAKRKNLDLLQMVSSGIISKEKFTEILKYCFSQNHGDMFKSYVKMLSGYIDEN